MDNDGIYYNAVINSSGVIVADTSKPLDSEGKPLANPEIVDGIALREVNRDAELIDWFFSDPLIS